MKKRWLVILIIFIIIAGIVTVVFPFVFMAFVWGSIACASYNQANEVPSPNPPAITSAEFPFTLVYERDGEEIIISDTLICEYVGDEWNGYYGNKFRTWEKSYSSGVEEIILAERSFDDCDVFIEFYDGYSAAYLMGDTEHFNYDCSGIYDYGIRKESSKGTSSSVLSKEELYSEYGVEIISFEMDAEPIENSFAPAE